MEGGGEGTLMAPPVESCSRDRIYRGAVETRESLDLTRSRAQKRNQGATYILPLMTTYDGHGRNVGFKGRRSRVE